MNFNSLHFLIYLPVVLIVYWLLPQKFRWVWLLAASYYFYMSWNAWLVFLIAGTTVVSYGAAILIERTQNKKVKKFWLAATLVVCLGTLVFFKYFNFLVQSAIDFLNLFSMEIDSFALDIILPVGISEYPAKSQYIWMQNSPPAMSTERLSASPMRENTLFT